jgi:hypothetical protein
MKLLTLEDYQKAGETFWPKYWYVAKELGEDAKPEDILKVMEAVGGVALKIALEEKEGPFGFLKTNEDGAPIIDSPEEAPPGTVAIYDTQSKQWGAYDL